MERILHGTTTMKMPDHRKRCEVHPDAIRLRPIVPADLPALFHMQSDPESNIMAGTKPRTREAFFTAWNGFFHEPALNAQVIEIQGGQGLEIVGTISCFQAEGHDCVGYWIARAHWGRGIASRALVLFLAAERRRPLHATTARNNAPSQHILTRHGFRCTGFRMGEETDRFLAREIADFVLE